jgi:hypothetical protein
MDIPVSSTRNTPNITISKSPDNYPPPDSSKTSYENAVIRLMAKGLDRETIEGGILTPSIEKTESKQMIFDNSTTS